MRTAAERWARVVLLVLLFLSDRIATGTPASEGAAQETGVYELERLLLSEAPRVVTSAAFREQTPEEAPSAVLVITAEEIRASGARSLGEVLERYAGLELVSGDRLLIRGLGPTNRVGGLGDAGRILLLVDGTRLNDVFADAFSVGLARGVDDISRIEVIKGPGSALYGTSAFAGVVQVITRRGEEIAGMEARARLAGPFTQALTVQAGGRRGSWEGALHGRAQLERLNPEGPAGALELRGSAAFRELSLTGGYLLLAPLSPPNEAPPEGPPSETAGIAPTDRTAAGVAPAFKTAGIAPAFKMATGVAATYWTAAEAEPARRLEQRADLALAGEHAFSRALQGTLRLSGNVGSIELSDQSFSLLESRLAGEGRLRARLAPWCWVIGGTEGRLEAADISRIGQAPALWTRQLLGLYTQAEVGPFWETTLTAGLRWEGSIADDSSLDARYAMLSPRVGLVSALPGRTTLKAFYGHAFQAPSLALLYQRTETGTQVIEPNPDLEPERMRSIEVELLKPFGRTFQARLNLFQDGIQDLIAPAYTDVEGVLRYENQYDARIRGLETELTWTPVRGLRTFGNLTLIDARDTRGGERLPLIPGARFNAGIAASPRPGTTAWLSASYVSTRQGTPGDPLPPELEIAGSLRVDARLSVDVGRRWQVALAVRNLLGAAGTDFQEGQLVELAGREAWLEVSFRPPFGRTATGQDREAGW